MGYTEYVCVLCGVSFNIARIRTPDEPPNCAWAHIGGSQDWVDAWCDGKGCSTENTGCFYLLRQYDEVDDAEASRTETYLFFDFGEGKPPVLGQQLPITRDMGRRHGRIAIDKCDVEHVGGPHCQAYGGYLGHRISAPEMRGCRTFQSLVPRLDSHIQEPDDLDIERRSKVILTGIDDASLPERDDSNHTPTPVDWLPARHAVCYGRIVNPFVDDYNISDAEFAFHPWCFGTYMQLSQLRLGYVEVDRLPSFFQNIGRYPRDFYYSPGSDVEEAWFVDMWSCNAGSEWLAANTYHVPKLRELLDRAMTTDASFNLQAGVFNSQAALRNTVNGPAVTPDNFCRLPQEIRNMILSYLNSRDIATLRVLDSHTSHPTIVSHTIDVQEHLSQWTLPKPPYGRTNWYMLYLDIKRNWKELRGLRNRERIWNYQEKMLVSLKMHIQDVAI
ncbi:hypothetical protein CA14_011003 [Aspergillus flavus]|uniref:F-box domain-containing protein n=1 Tax=Aspergillus flavus TaxID=5059 RepID=A0AB74CHF9_ASPFL|nr:hypothetical protein CA14_011003 [Aspergillus flavus]